MAHASAEAHSHSSVVRVTPAVWAGLISGLAFLVFEMAMLALMGQSPWGPPRMMAAIILGQSVLPPPDAYAAFNPGVVLVAMIVHFALSIIYAVVFALVAERMAMSRALIAGAAFGLALYVVNFHGFTAIFPWFEMARGIGSIAGHVVYGLILAFAYKRLAHRQPGQD